MFQKCKPMRSYCQTYIGNLPIHLEWNTDLYIFPVKPNGRCVLWIFTVCSSAVAYVRTSTYPLRTVYGRCSRCLENLVAIQQRVHEEITNNHLKSTLCILYIYIDLWIIQYLQSCTNSVLLTILLPFVAIISICYCKSAHIIGTFDKHLLHYAGSYSIHLYTSGFHFVCYCLLLRLCNVQIISIGTFAMEKIYVYSIYIIKPSQEMGVRTWHQTKKNTLYTLIIPQEGNNFMRI